MLLEYKGFFSIVLFLFDYIYIDFYKNQKKMIFKF